MPADSAASLIVTNIGPLMSGSCLMTPAAQSPNGLAQPSAVSSLVKSASMSWHFAAGLVASTDVAGPIAEIRHTASATDVIGFILNCFILNCFILNCFILNCFILNCFIFVSFR